MLKNLRKIFIILLLIFVLIFTVVIYFVNFNKIKRADKYLNSVLSISKQYDLEADFVLAVIYTESKFKSDAISSKGAVGLMQVMPKTADFVSEKMGKSGFIDLKNPYENIDIGCFYLRYLYGIFNDKELVLCAYNAGEGRVKNWLIDERYSKDGKTLFKIPYKETSDYLKRVMKMQKYYKKYLDKKAYYEKK